MPLFCIRLPIGASFANWFAIGRNRPAPCRTANYNTVFWMFKFPKKGLKLLLLALVGNLFRIVW